MEQRSKTKEILAVIAILLCNFSVMHDMPIVVITDSLYKAFPDQMFGVNMLISGAMVISTVGSLLAPNLLKKFSKKQLIVVCSFIYAISSSLGAWKENILYMNLVNIVCMLMQGIIMVCGIGLITDMFAYDEKKLSRYMGFNNSAMSLIGAALSYTAGIFAMNGWTNVYRIYYAGFIIAVVMVFFLPNHVEAVAEEEVSEEQKALAKQKKFGSNFWLTALVFLLSYFVYVAAVVFVSVYIASNEIGDSAFVGTMSTVGTLSSFVVCLGLGTLVSKLGRKIIVTFDVFMIIGALAMAVAPGVATCVIGSILIAGGYGGLFAYSFIALPSIVPPEKSDRAISFVTIIGLATNLVGMNLTAVLMNSIGINNVILIGVAVSVVAILLEAAVNVKMKRENAA